MFLRSVHTIYTIEVNTTTKIQTTSRHPFYIEGEGWVIANQLQVGMNLQTMNGTAVITNLKKERTDEVIPVYNFRVSGWSSYFVSEWNVYVHNAEYNGNNRTKFINPTGTKGGKPKGNYANPDGGRGLIRQNETANLFAAEGYDITMLDEVQGGNGYGLKKTSNPDFIIEKEVFDCYSPEPDTPIDKVCGYIKEKTKKQSKKIVLNLDDYPTSQIEKLKSTILQQTTSKANEHLRYLDELIIVRDNKIENFFVR